MNVPLLHRVRQMSPDQLLFSEYGLSKAQKRIMTVWGIVFSQLANPVGDAIYFLFFQLEFPVIYPKGHVTYADWYLGDLYDRFPLHLQSVLNHIGFRIHWFTGPVAPDWWVADRHLGRRIIIGICIMFMAQLLTVGMGEKDHKPLSRWAMAGRTAAVPVIALTVTVAGVLFFTKVWPGVLNYGAFQNVPYVNDWLSATAWQAILIGLLAGLASKRVFRPVAATLQLASIDNKLMRNETEKPWWRFVYTPAYRRRFEYLQEQKERKQHTPKDHGKVIGVALTVFAFGFTALLIIGVLVKYLGPAAHAH